MKKFKEWLSDKDSNFAEKLYSDVSLKPKRVTHDPEEEKGKKDGWQPEMMEFPSDTEKTKDELPKNTVWVHNADQWSDKDRTAK